MIDGSVIPQHVNAKWGVGGGREERENNSHDIDIRKWWGVAKLSKISVRVVEEKYFDCFEKNRFKDFGFEI